MFSHGPSCLNGPVSRERGWWSPDELDSLLPGGTEEPTIEGPRDRCPDDRLIRTELVDRRVSLAEFRRSLEQDAPELAADARAARASADRWAGRVEMVLPGDERVMVVREGSAWRLADRPLDPFGQD